MAVGNLLSYTVSHRNLLTGRSKESLVLLSGRSMEAYSHVDQGSPTLRQLMETHMYCTLKQVKNALSGRSWGPTLRQVKKALPSGRSREPYSLVGQRGLLSIRLRQDTGTFSQEGHRGPLSCRSKGQYSHVSKEGCSHVGKGGLLSSRSKGPFSQIGQGIPSLRQIKATLYPDRSRESYSQVQYIKGALYLHVGQGGLLLGRSRGALLSGRSKGPYSQFGQEWPHSQVGRLRAPTLRQVQRTPVQ